MGKKATKAADNMYYLARCEAARETGLQQPGKAAELVGIDRTDWQGSNWIPSPLIRRKSRLWQRHIIPRSCAIPTVPENAPWDATMYQRLTL